MQSLQRIVGLVKNEILATRSLSYLIKIKEYD